MSVVVQGQGDSPALDQSLQQVVGPDEVGPVAPLDGPPGQGHRQVGRAHAGRPQRQDVRGLGHEGQFLDLPLVNGGLEGEVELLQGALEREVGHLGPGAEVALPSSLHLGAQQLFQHLWIGQLLAGGGVQGVVQDLDGLLEAEALQVLTGLLQGDHLAPPTAASS